MSSTTKTFRSATRLRYRFTWAATSGRMRSGDTPNPSRNPRTASATATGGWDGSNPRRST
ncbi:hypothetical protein BBK82_04315 [Lentzea guizhouensis]|uniref:Uncharacterized protein n=1 Tax=Lentzea guizhouensis TaxID=1586287 RepID=A0A1B2HCG7_9PSEU|nr:hypothetical protein BBK82_04315 [Lentzea guizhouensis]